MSDRIRVALLFGGRSTEHEVSLVSASSVFKNLDPAKFEPISIYITKEGLWKRVAAPSTDQAALNKGRAMSFLPWGSRGQGLGLEADIYFPVLHGSYGEDGTIQGLLEMAGVPYVGCGVAASALGMDKVLAKTLWEARDLPVVPYVVLDENEWKKSRTAVAARLKKRFHPPFFVKPSRLGSSVGISKVKSHDGTAAALDRAFGYDGECLVEDAIIGRELECSVLGNDRPEASVPGEVIPHREFYDYRDKYIEGRTEFIVPAALPARTIERIRSLAVKAFAALGGSGFARVDFLQQGRGGQIYINEINTIPGFTEISMYPRLWEASGLPFPRLVERLIELGFEKHQARKVRVDWD